jgi:hypothetical protein
MSAWAEPTAPDPTDRPARHRHPAWLVPGLLALIVFELTTDPALTVAVGCLKFGWDALATARWLKRTDPDRARGRICARFYAAWALWRVSLVAVAMMFVLVILLSIVEGKRPPNAGPVPPPPGFMGACLTAMSGFLLSAWMSNLAVVTAWRRGVRVWVGPEAGRARKGALWPPSLATTARARPNRAGAVVLSALLTDLTVLGLFALIVGLNRAPAPQAGQGAPDAVVLILIFAGILVPPFAVLALRDSIRRRLIADSPFQCWPPDEVHPLEEDAP